MSDSYPDAHRCYANVLAAAERGDELAMADLGAMFAAGDGVPQDYGEARRWFEKAAAAGSDDAMIHLSVLYANGWGVVQDYAETHQWLEKAVAVGNDDAMFRLGELYRTGLGVPRDWEQAHRWYEQAAEAENGDAMFALSRLYLMSGSGSRSDMDKGRHWVDKAAAAGNVNAREILQKLGQPSQKSGGCFIATAACGSVFEPEVRMLQAFRDGVLRKRVFGRVFIQVYERVSPSIARWIGHRPLARCLVRLVVIGPCASVIGVVFRGIGIELSPANLSVNDFDDQISSSARR